MHKIISIGAGIAFFIFSAGDAIAGKLAVLHQFTGGRDGGDPEAPLIFDRDGNLYGTTEVGGAKNLGVIFKLGADGSETVLFSFKGKGDGKIPIAGLFNDKAGNLFGSTKLGGDSTCDEGKGCGVVFRLATDGAFSTLHKFRSGSDGAFLHAGLIGDRHGNLFGTTSEGGDPACTVDNEPVGCGTVFEIAPDGHETILHRFEGVSDGRVIYAGLLGDASGNLFGTARVGGSDNCSGGCGVVFTLTPDGIESILHAFAGGDDGAYPEAALVADSGGNMYGTTVSGGSSNCFGDGCGTVFKLAHDGKMAVLYAFAGGTDGSTPHDLAWGPDGNLYGTTSSGGGSCDCGAVFRITPNGDETVLYSFSGAHDGAYPDAGLVIDRKGRLYGTASAGGDFGYGTVFRLNP